MKLLIIGHHPAKSIIGLISLNVKIKSHIVVRTVYKIGITFLVVIRIIFDFLIFGNCFNCKNQLYGYSFIVKLALSNKVDDITVTFQPKVLKIHHYNYRKEATTYGNNYPY